jgi:RNA polymerase sigma factor (sigma-70 family)
MTSATVSYPRFRAQKGLKMAGDLRQQEPGLTTSGAAKISHGEVGELLCRARAGDRVALDQLVRQLTPLVWNVARARGLDKESASDVVQATWLAFLENLHAIRSPMAVAAWLVTVTRNQAQRSRSAARRVEFVEPNDLSLEPDPVAGFETAVADREQYRCLWENLRELPPTCQELLRILAFTGHTSRRQVLEVFDMPPGSIGPTRIRCLKKLKDLLQADPRWDPQ